jgi:hypothetical protein
MLVSSTALMSKTAVICLMPHQPSKPLFKRFFGHAVPSAPAGHESGCCGGSGGFASMPSRKFGTAPHWLLL